MAPLNHTGSSLGKFQGLCHTLFLPQARKKKVPQWKEALCVLLEQSSNVPWALKQQPAFKPKTSSPFLQEIRQAPNQTEPLG